MTVQIEFRTAIAIALAVALALPSLASAQTVVFCVDDTSDLIDGITTTDPPACHDGSSPVTESVIRAADPPGASGAIEFFGTWDGTSYADAALPGLLDPNSVEIRRVRLARQIVDNWLPFLSPALSADDMKKLAGHIEAMTRVLLADANLQADSGYIRLHGEVAVSGGSFLRYSGPDWLTFYDASTFPAGAWVWHTIHGAINAGTATDGATGGTPVPSAATLTTPISWPVEIAKLTAP